MWNICYVCLRNNKELRTLDQSDLTVYNELCGYNVIHESTSHKFCSECVARLRRCRDFKKQCNMANTLMRMWINKQSSRDSIYDLHKDLPASHLDICDRKNFKVYFCQSSDIASTSPMQMYNSHPSIANINIPQDEQSIINSNEVDLGELKRETGCVDEGQIKIEYIEENKEDNDEGLDDNDVLNDNERLVDDEPLIDVQPEGFIIYEHVNTIEVNDDEQKLSPPKVKRKNSIYEELGLNDYELHDEILDDKAIEEEINNFSDIDEMHMLDDGASESDSDESVEAVIKQMKTIIKREKDKRREELIVKHENDRIKRENNKIKMEKTKIKRDNKSKSNGGRLNVLERFKNMLRRKMAASGEIKDDKGNVVDFDKILDNSDKMPVNELRTCIFIIRRAPVLNYSIVQKLCEVQAKFIEYSSMFDIQFLNNPAEAHTEFSRRHEYPDYVKSKFRCEDCFRGFEYQKKLVFHRRIAHNASRPISCVICKMRFSDRNNLVKHWGKTHSAVYKCKMCSYIVASREGIDQHYRQHLGIKYRCEYCGAEYSHYNQRFEHMKKVHYVKMANIFCELCAYPTHSQKGLVFHKMRMHSDEKFAESEWNRKCEECNVTFKNDDVYQKHLRISHKDKVFVKKNRTMRKKPRRVVCRLCDFSKSGTTWLAKHFREAHPTENMAQVYRDYRKFLCDECGKGFQHKKALEYHMNEHSDTRPHVCPECSRAYHSRHKLLVHMYGHQPPTHECDECGKKFHNSTRLKTHFMTHREDRSHICEYCGKGFKYKAMLTEHVKGVHMNIRRKRKKIARCMETWDAD